MDKNLYDMMVLRQMTIKELSEKSGVSRMHIGALLKGKYSHLSMKILKSLASALSCTPAWLLRK